MSKRNKDNVSVGSKDIFYGVLALILFIISVIIFSGFLGAGGDGGNRLYNSLFGQIGYFAILLPIILVYVSFKLWHKKFLGISIAKYLGLTLFILSLAGLMSLSPIVSLSGELGLKLSNLLSELIGVISTFIVFVIGTYTGLMLIFGRRNILHLEEDSLILRILRKLNVFSFLYNFIFVSEGKSSTSNINSEDEEDEDEEDGDEDAREISEKDNRLKSNTKSQISDDGDEEILDKPAAKINKPNTLGIKFVAPPLDLLSNDSGKSSAGDTRSMAKAIENVLRDFDINVEMSGATVGPTVTQYRIKPPQGVPVRKILSLKDDIQLALSVNNIHIEAPIPGKPYVGIEVPNKDKQTLGLRAMFEDEGFKNSNNLTVAIGRSITNKPIYADIENMPHLLIAGATKSGKSVTIQNILMSLLYKNSPDDLKLVVIDPKKVEFTLYKNLPHLGTPVIADAKNAIKCLNWAIAEMERRYEYFAENYAGIQNLADYNRKIYNPYIEKNKKRIPIDGEDEPERLSFIIIIFDEFNDFMLSYPKEITTAITSLTQKGRAAGIHLILATQRPDVKVITGTIKANIPARIALKTSSSIDSRTILDSIGAEDLLGKGDMLFMEPGEPRPVRVQAPFVSSEEIESVIGYIKSRYYGYEGITIDYSKAKDSISAASIGSSRGGGDDEEGDDYNKAKEYVILTQRASASGLQSKFGWGFPKANGMIMRLEDNKVVTPLESNKRQVLIKADEVSNAEDNY